MFCIKRILCLLLVLILAGCSSLPKQNNATAFTDYEVALTAMQAGQDEAAIDRFSEMTLDYPRLAGPYANLGLLYQRQGLMKQASVAFDKAIQLQPESAKIYNSAAVFYRSQGRFKDAESAYRQAIEKAADYADPVLNLAILYDLYLQQPVMAIKYYKHYLTMTDVNKERVTLWLADLEQRQP